MGDGKVAGKRKAVKRKPTIAPIVETQSALAVSRDPKRTKLAIVGWAATSRDQVVPLFNDNSFDVWGCNELGMRMQGRWSAWFNIHKRSEIGDESVAWLAQVTVPVYMLEHFDDIPCSVAFPFDAMFKHFGYPDGIRSKPKPYFTNTIQDQIALGIMMGYEEIHVYGVDMALDSEYQYQRPACEWMIGWAQGRGIKVHIPIESHLMRTPWTYGVEDPPTVNGPLTKKFFQDRITMLSRDRQNHHDNTMRLDGAIKQQEFELKQVEDWERDLGGAMVGMPVRQPDGTSKVEGAA